MTRLANFNADKHINRIPIEKDEQYIRLFAEQVLARRDFKGVYLERRWVEPLNDYRDIIVINDRCNEELTKDIDIVKKRLREFYGDQKWIGITDPKCIGAPAKYCLWVKPWNKPFGEHEFRIKEVIFSEAEVYVSIKSKRLIDVNTNGDVPENPPPSIKRSSDLNNSANVIENLDATSHLLENVMVVLAEVWSLLTKENLISTVKFLSILLVSLCTFLIEAIKFLGEFTIRFMNAFSNLIHVSMPLLLALVDVLQKTIGGFYLLLAMIWRSLINGDSGPIVMQQSLLPPGPRDYHPKLSAYKPRPRYPQQMYNQRHNARQYF